MDFGRATSPGWRLPHVPGPDTGYPVRDATTGGPDQAHVAQGGAYPTTAQVALNRIGASVIVKIHGSSGRLDRAMAVTRQVLHV